ncbi:MAG: hypothetical protein LBT19_00470 [Candidatus Nomurabacteria bacterium]|jgi:hypothetical protein|nr:hypothetical protein [Candidatus Nomurabacteria bacterium]
MYEGNNSVFSTGVAYPAVAEKKSRKKFLIVAGITVAIVAIAVIVIFIILTAKPSAKDVRRDFNLYANYLLYGTESVEDISGIYQYGDMYHYAKLRGDELDNYVLLLREKYQKFISAYQKNDQFDSDVVSRYGDNLDLFLLVRQYPNISAQDLLLAYIEQRDGLSELIGEYYASFTSSSAENAVTYGENYQDNLYALIDVYERYDAEGCLNRDSGTIKTSCRANTTKPSIVALNKEYFDLVSFGQEALGIVKDLSVGVFEDIWKIKVVLYAQE